MSDFDKQDFLIKNERKKGTKSANCFRHI